VVEIKALACQLPKDLGLPFSRLSRDEIARQAIKRGVVASISGATVWRWLSADAIRPWCYRSWIWLWICTTEPGMPRRWARTTSWFALMKKPASRPDDA